MLRRVEGTPPTQPPNNTPFLNLHAPSSLVESSKGEIGDLEEPGTARIEGAERRAKPLR